MDGGIGIAGTVGTFQVPAELEQLEPGKCRKKIAGHAVWTDIFLKGDGTFQVSAELE